MKQRDTKYGVLHLVIGSLFLIASALPSALGGTAYSVWLIFLWPAVDLLVLGSVYLVDGNCGVLLLGKSQVSGKLSPISIFIFLPYLFGAFVFWRIKHLWKGEHVCDKVAHGIWVGRYPLHLSVDDPRFAEQPLKIVVDLTGEFPTRRAFHGRTTYLCAPSLDGLLADPRVLLDTARAVITSYDAERNHSVYVHCANGHGRSGLFAGILMVMRGDCSSLEEARVLMKSRRSVIGWQPHQQRIAEETLHLWKHDIELTKV